MNKKLLRSRPLALLLAGFLLAGCGAVPRSEASGPAIALAMPGPSGPGAPAPTQPEPEPEQVPLILPPPPVILDDPIGALIEAEEPIEPIDPGRRALEVARELLGVPYAFGGSSPRGFDCSGLVRYAFGRVGVELPRTSAEQYRCVQPIDLEQLAPGDLLFFQITRKRISHVGIYDADDFFIHAPSNGKEVSRASLRDPYWRKRLVGIGRIVR